MSTNESARAALRALEDRVRAPRLGKSVVREMDRDIIAMRQAAQALAALLPPTDQPEPAEPSVVVTVPHSMSVTCSEAAHAPTDDDREALVSHARRENADRYAEDVRTLRGFAERERRAARAWEFFTRDDREMSHDFRGGYHQGMIDGSRLSEVPEPSGESVEGILDRATLDEYMRGDPDETYASLVVKANALASTVRRLLDHAPQGEPSDARRLVHEVNMLLSSVASHGPAALTDTSDRMYTPGLLRRLRDALDPKPAQRLAAGNAVRAEMARNGLDVHRMVHGRDIANVLAGAALDAALRAAGGVVGE